jgi:flagellar basal-body rod protein FlgB
MSLTEPLLIQKLNSKIGYLSERQTLLAKNIANIDTPNYHAQDLKKQNFDTLVSDSSSKLAMMTTSPKHIELMDTSPRYAVDTHAKTVQQKPGGNNVVLEEQMGNVSDVSIQHQMTSTLLKKFHQLYRIAVDNKG